ncbi:hypothetical protein MM221_06920 [Salipaludibacillus sp. LMS25]|uniref:hypothetical protein n=1 Tax=Salipaludibacillus sp. LMS25 TaxID=2924031 RepID=UPI0020D020F3|nr:hypothetical protein [Salipaludibacillus sp. LMS25]UTR16276.1 hypothetical protein MM221_06920 [Salipaludibacillus sp. LMS25]
MDNKNNFAFILIASSLLITIFLIIKPEHLIPDGYELAIDGYVIAKTLMLIFGLNLLFNLGTFLIKQKNS